MLSLFSFHIFVQSAQYTEGIFKRTSRKQTDKKTKKRRRYIQTTVHTIQHRKNGWGKRTQQNEQNGTHILLHKVQTL